MVEPRFRCQREREVDLEEVVAVPGRWGYPAFWVTIVAMAGGVILYFRRKRWW